MLLVSVLALNKMQVRLAGNVQPDSIVDGEGIRVVVWMQGCSHNCQGCHNPNTHSFDGGFLSDTEEVKKEISKLKSITGVTLSGGDPMFQIEASLDIAKFAHQIGLNVWCYTGYTFEQLLAIARINSKMLELLKELDVVVDGKFTLEEKSADVKFRGSKNQRIIDVPKSLKENKAINVEKYDIKESGFVKEETLYI